MKNIFKLMGLPILITALAVSITIGIQKIQNPIYEDVQIKEGPSAFRFQDFIIVSKNVIGLHIKEWPIASYDNAGSIFEVQIILDGQEHPRGPIFDSYEEAEKAMLYLSKECGYEI